MAVDPIVQLTNIRDGYLAALVADALNPKLDYDIDGQAVNRSAWRAGLMKEIAGINAIVQMFQPFEIQTLAVN